MRHTPRRTYSRSSYRIPHAPGEPPASCAAGTRSAGADGVDDRGEAIHGHDGALPPDRRRLDPDDAVQTHLRGPALRVPVTRADVDVRGAVLVRADVPRTARHVVPAREHETQEPAVLAPDQQDRTVLAPRVVLLVRDPPPHDLAGIRVPVEVRCVQRLDRPAEVARVAAVGSLGESLRWPGARCAAGAIVLSTPVGSRRPSAGASG